MAEKISAPRGSFIHLVGIINHKYTQDVNRAICSENPAEYLRSRSFTRSAAYLTPYNDFFEKMRKDLEKE